MKKLSINDKQDIIKLYCDNEKAKNIAKFYNVDVRTISNVLRDFNISYRQGTRKYFYNEDFFSEFDQDSCYWAGFIAADGNISKNVLSISLNKKDVDHLKKFFQSLNTNNNKIEYRKDNSVRINICSKKIVSDLKMHFNIVENKSLILKWPQKLPQNMFSHFIRGIFDGDGCAYLNKKRKQLCLSITSGSLNFLEDIKKHIFNLLNVTCHIYIKRHNNYALYKGGIKDVICLCNWLYKNSNFKLDRKYQKYVDFLKLRSLNASQ